MTCKRLFTALLLVFLSPLLLGDGLTETQTYELKSLLIRYEQNEMRLSDELKVLNQNLEKLYQESADLKTQSDGLRLSLTKSQLQAQALMQGLENMGQSIETLETSLTAMEAKATIYKYGFFAVTAVAIVEAIIIGLR